MLGSSLLPAKIGSDDLVLGIDIGTGTQDILLRVRGLIMENCPKMVLPSPTVLKGREVGEVTAARRPLFLDGRLMGGGPVSRAVKEHLRNGLPVFATPVAAKTFRDDLEEVKGWGVSLVTEQPPSTTRVVLGDVDRASLQDLFRPLALPPFGGFAVAVQDHGESIGESNRVFRFKLWRSFLEREGGDLFSAVHRKARHPLTRMMAVQEALPDSVVCDTGIAAVLGALFDPAVRQAAAGGGVIIVNAGNGHTLGIALLGERVTGLFEHHTSRLSPAKLDTLVRRLREGTITHAEVFDDGGHGAAVGDHHPRGGFGEVAVTGPLWAVARDLGYRRVAPFGDMMLTGAYGLIAAWDRIVAGKGDPWS